MVTERVTAGSRNLVVGFDVVTFGALIVVVMHLGSFFLRMERINFGHGFLLSARNDSGGESVIPFVRFRT